MGLRNIFHVGTVDVAEECLILKAVFQRKSDCQRVAVATAEQSILGNILKRCALLQGRKSVVDVDLHDKSTRVGSTKVPIFQNIIKDAYI